MQRTNKSLNLGSKGLLNFFYLNESDLIILLFRQLVTIVLFLDEVTRMLTMLRKLRKFHISMLLLRSASNNQVLLIARCSMSATVEDSCPRTGGYVTPPKWQPCYFYSMFLATHCCVHLSASDDSFFFSRISVGSPVLWTFEDEWFPCCRFVQLWKVNLWPWEHTPSVLVCPALLSESLPLVEARPTSICWPWWPLFLGATFTLQIAQVI